MKRPIASISLSSLTGENNANEHRDKRTSTRRRTQPFFPPAPPLSPPGHCILTQAKILQRPPMAPKRTTTHRRSSIGQDNRVAWMDVLNVVADGPIEDEREPGHEGGLFSGGRSSSSYDNEDAEEPMFFPQPPSNHDLPNYGQHREFSPRLVPRKRSYICERFFHQDQNENLFLAPPVRPLSPLRVVHLQQDLYLPLLNDNNEGDQESRQEQEAASLRQPRRLSMSNSSHNSGGSERLDDDIEVEEEEDDGETTAL